MTETTTQRGIREVLAEQVRTLRSARGMSQAQLAAQVGLLRSVDDEDEYTIEESRDPYPSVGDDEPSRASTCSTPCGSRRSRRLGSGGTA